MRPIDADVLKPTLKAIIEAETQVYGRGSWGFATRCLSAVEDAPTVEPERKKGKWIPCSERLPEESGRYIITAYDGVSRRTATAVFQKRLGGWCLSGRMAYWRVVAWMPPPEPYQEEGESQ